MKIITITKEDKNVISNRNNLDFINMLSNYFDYKCIPVFNRKIGKITVPIETVLKEKPDIIICHTHNRLLSEYLSKVKCLKIMVAVDIRKLREDYSFYHDNKFNMVIHRGWLPEEQKKDIGIKSMWLPYSANEKEFFPIKPGRHIKKVCFAGTLSSPYKIRQLAITELEKYGLIENRGKVKPSLYPEIIRKYRIGLTSSEIKSPTGRVFEVMLSGSILLANDFNDVDYLGLKDCFIHYENDISDIADKAKYYIDNDNEAKKIIDRGLEVVRRKHTHAVRIKEFVNMIERI